MRTLAILMMIFGPVFLFCQTENPGAWYTYNGNWTIKDSWSTKLLVQYRSKSINPHLDKMLLWGGLYYQKEQSSWKFGLYYYQLDNYITDVADEVSYLIIYNHYLGQEVKYTYQWKGINWTPKIRLEQVKKPGSNIYQQSRLSLSYSVPYRKWAIKGYGETFVIVTGLRYNRTRLYAGISRKINNNLQLELGMMSEIFLEHSKNYFMLKVVTKM